MQNIKQMTDENDFKFKKKFGQNFLMDENIINKIVSQALVGDETIILEIGVGSGNLTKKLALNAKTVIGYEIDQTLKPLIFENLGALDNVEIIFDDFLKRNIVSDLKKYSYDKIYVIANLPYYITTPIITKLIEDHIDIEKMIIMVQKEVGERLGAKPGCKEYNSLTIFINYYFEVKRLFDVSKNVFIPKPNVDSSIMQLTKRTNKHKLVNENQFFKLVRDSFRQKRKTLKNNLNGYDLQKIESTLQKYELDLTVRAENLTIEQFVDIANNL